MSAYAHQMEREISALTLSSRENSEMGSRYHIESGFYMDTLTATILLASLITIGVLLVTLLIALAIMLQSCQKREAGNVELQKEYNHCKILSSHAEINNGLEIEEFPEICREIAIRYIKEGDYTRDLGSAVAIALKYFYGLRHSDDGLDVVLIDIDDGFTLDRSRYISQMTNRLDKETFIDSIEEAKHLKQLHLLDLYKKLRSNGWSIIILTRKPEQERNFTLGQLFSAGYYGWSLLLMRPDNGTSIDNRDYYSSQRMKISKGYRIAGVISFNFDALTGPCTGNRIFKLPNPISFGLENFEKRKTESAK